MKPTSRFPSICIDGFYSEPDEIIKWASSLDYCRDDKAGWPGWRTPPLSTIDYQFDSDFSKRLMGVFFDIDRDWVSWEIQTHFQIIQPFAEDKKDPRNWGWVHQDSDGVYNPITGFEQRKCEYAGIIYLTPDADLDTGTSIFRSKEENPSSDQPLKRELFSGQEVNPDEYSKNMVSARSQFEETIRYCNVYNRLIAFEAKNYHAAMNFKMNSDKIRLTQVFFIKNVRTQVNPILRGFLR